MSKIIALAEKAKTATAELADIIETEQLIEKRQPKAATTATAKYQESKGIVSRSYKLKAEDADAFKAACTANGESQAAVLSRLMAEYCTGESSRTTCWWCRLMKKLGR